MGPVCGSAQTLYSSMRPTHLDLDYAAWIQSLMLGSGLQDLASSLLSSECQDWPQDPMLLLRSIMYRDWPCLIRFPMGPWGALWAGWQSTGGQIWTAGQRLITPGLRHRTSLHRKFVQPPVMSQDNLLLQLMKPWMCLALAREERPKLARGSMEFFIWVKLGVYKCPPEWIS